MLPAGDKLVHLFRTHWYDLFGSLLNIILALREPLVHLMLILQLAICQASNVVYKSQTVNIIAEVV
jgi:hypothetical protein